MLQPPAGPEVDAVAGTADISEDSEPVFDVVVEHRPVFVVEIGVAEPGVLVFVAASVPVVAGLQASDDILAVFVPGVSELQTSVDILAVFLPDVAGLQASVDILAVFVPDVAELQASADILVVFAFLVLASADASEVDRPGRPRFFAVPNVDHYANSSSCAEDLD